ncbi:hypothetical protein niasHT_032002 [Heterodera trifolii]|uniref:Uncharacterized protein n=1 Tax=Heterodera trifolii TaxID=157864 RepID=A0ABD2I5S1_9BILA
MGGGIGICPPPSSPPSKIPCHCYAPPGFDGSLRWECHCCSGWAGHCQQQPSKATESQQLLVTLPQAISARAFSQNGRTKGTLNELSKWRGKSKQH